MVAVAGDDIMVASALSLDVLQKLGFRDGRVDFDIAEASLRCAVGLPGAEGLDVNAKLARLDEIAVDVKRIIFLKENYDQFLNNPGKFHNSQAYFCVVCMISILKRKYHVGYNPKWKHVTPETEVPDDFGKDSRDQFIHAILDGIGGTCGSLPVFIVAVGRRIGMPLKLVKAYRHLFIRWDDPQGLWNSPDGLPHPSQGEVFNIEATGRDVHRLSDAEYRYRWPRAIPDEHLKSGIFLKSLTPEEELSEFLTVRAYCLLRAERLAEGLAALQWSSQLAPHNTVRKKQLDDLLSHVEVAEQGSYYINQPPPNPHQETPIGPHWVHTNGQRLLVQILRPEHLSPMTPCGMNSAMTVGLSLQRHSVDLPNGHRAWAEVPTHGTAQDMEASWIELSPNEFALVHKPLIGAYRQPDLQRMGQPILPERNPKPWETPSPHPRNFPVHQRQALSHWEEHSIKIALQTAAEQPIPAAALPRHLIPAINSVPTHSYLRRTPGHATQLPHLLT